MAVSYANFKTKYPGFIDLPELLFNQHLADALLIVNMVNWSALGSGWELIKDKAVESWLACQLSTNNPEYLGAAGLAEFEVKEASYRLKYLSNSGGSRNNPYCQTYQNLLDMVDNATPNNSNLPANTKGVIKDLYW